MEVTQKNFREVLPNIKLQLKDAEFISYDLELTGLGRSHGIRNHDLDTPEERYLKDRSRVMDYGITQIGLSIFKFCHGKKKYVSSTYCFFLSGNIYGSYRYDASSMIFLAENGFDFNKLFNEGLPFMSLLEEQELREKRAAKLLEDQELPTLSPVKIKSDDSVSKKFVMDATKKIKEALDKKEPSVIFPFSAMTGFHRKLLYNNVAPNFPKCSFRSNKARDIEVLFFYSEGEKLKNQDLQWEEEFNEKIYFLHLRQVKIDVILIVLMELASQLSCIFRLCQFLFDSRKDNVCAAPVVPCVFDKPEVSKLGFTHVVKALLESNKPLVGHNIYLDVLHFVDKFIAPLPESYIEFKSLVKANLNCFYDTKLIAKDPPFSEDIVNTALGVLYTELTENYSPPEIGIDSDCHSYKLTDTGQAHDGGYDAFMTGICLITMLKTLDKKKWANSVSPMKSKFLKSYVNRINFMGSYDIPFLDIDKPEVIPKRYHIFCVQCPSTFKTVDVRNLFFSLKSYKMLWANDTQLYVIPQDEEDIIQASVILESLKAICPPNVHVSLYNDSVNVATNGKLDAHSSRQLKSTHMTPPVISKRHQDGESAEANKNLKRLKSVGSDQLSTLSLESPTDEGKEIMPITQKDLWTRLFSEQQKFQGNIFKQLRILSDQNVFIFQKLEHVTKDFENISLHNANNNTQFSNNAVVTDLINANEFATKKVYGESSSKGSTITSGNDTNADYSEHNDSNEETMLNSSLNSGTSNSQSSYRSLLMDPKFSLQSFHYIHNTNDIQESIDETVKNAPINKPIPSIRYSKFKNVKKC